MRCAERLSGGVLRLAQESHRKAVNRALLAEVRTTDSYPDLPIAPNLLEQTFVATRPNQIADQNRAWIGA